MRDDELRATCFLALDALRAQLGDVLPYRGVLDRRFRFRHVEIPFLSTQKGIFRAAAQSGPAALAVQTSAKSPYRDTSTEDGFLYDYRAGSATQADNRALRAAYELQVPIVYYVGVNPGNYRPEYPMFVTADDPHDRRVMLAPGHRTPSGITKPIADELERRYRFVEVRARLHQSRFRARVIPAYRSQCAICRLKEESLLDAAHIVGDAEERGEPAITNGLSLCSIHHRSFDEDLVGVSPDYEVRVAPRLLEEEDGPMLDLLKGFDRQQILVPEHRPWRPDRERLALRFERFAARSGT